MWLEVRERVNLIEEEPNDLAIPISVDVKAYGPFDDEVEHGLKQWEIFTVGRILADKIDRERIEEFGESVWNVADADSSGLEAAWAALLDETGEFRHKDFESIGDPVVYLYRFALHQDFVDWRMPVLHSFCGLFPYCALILAQYHTMVLSQTEFECLGFEELPPTIFPAPAGFVSIDRDTRFMVRENTFATEFGVPGYPQEAPDACKEHQDWLEQQGPWEGLC